MDQQTGRQTDTQANRQTDQQTNRQTDRQADRLTRLLTAKKAFGRQTGPDYTYLTKCQNLQKKVQADKQN